MTRRTPARFTSPWDALRDMREQMDELLRSAFRGPAARVAGFEPAVNITEREDALVLTAELPGMKREDIDIDVQNNVLTIRGEKTEEREEEEKERFVYEREYGSFSRSFTLPRTVDPERIQARFENGVLTITMPKVEAARGKRVRIEGGETST